MSPSNWVRFVGPSCLLIAGAFAVPALTEDAKKGKRYALLVGVTEYESSKLPPLTYTENDVVKLAEVLRGKAAGFDEVRVLTNKGGKKDAPTAANIRAALAELTAKRNRHDTVLIALSGHGLQLEVPDPEEKAGPKTYGYFCPSDADLSGKVSHSTGKSATLVLVTEVLDALDRCGAGTKLLLMDACRNELKAESSTRSLDVRRFAIPENAAALFSCKPGQRAYESARLKHGVFFHFVLEGLRGKARNDKGAVTWSRLVEYVQNNVSDAVDELIGGGASQEPNSVSNLSGKSPVLARLDAAEDVAPKDPKDVKDKDRSGKEPVVKPGKDEPGKDRPGKEPAFKLPLGSGRTNSVGMKFVRVKAGKFTMGATKGDAEAKSDEKPAHEVEITRSFYLGAYEVTQKQFKEVMGYNPSYFSKDGKGDGSNYDKSQPAGGKERVKDVSDRELEQFPVENVSHAEAMEFVRKLNEKERDTLGRYRYSLPTEAQWEYACRAGTSSKYHFGDSITAGDANFAESKLGRPCKVGSYRPNAFGLYDMHGNVQEWCLDHFNSFFYKDSPKTDPLCLKGTGHAVRGGGWFSKAGECRVSSRLGLLSKHRYSSRGFRVALVPAR